MKRKVFDEEVGPEKQRHLVQFEIHDGATS
jgi:hypothetical protein